MAGDITINIGAKSTTDGAARKSINDLNQLDAKTKSFGSSLRGVNRDIKGLLTGFGALRVVRFIKSWAGDLDEISKRLRGSLGKDVEALDNSLGRVNASLHHIADTAIARAAPALTEVAKEFDKIVKKADQLGLGKAAGEAGLALLFGPGFSFKRGAQLAQGEKPRSYSDETGTFNAQRARSLEEAQKRANMLVPEGGYFADFKRRMAQREFDRNQSPDESFNKRFSELQGRIGSLSGIRDALNGQRGAAGTSDSARQTMADWVRGISADLRTLDQQAAAMPNWFKFQAGLKDLSKDATPGGLAGLNKKFQDFAKTAKGFGDQWKEKQAGDLASMRERNMTPLELLRKGFADADALKAAGATDQDIAREKVRLFKQLPGRGFENAPELSGESARFLLGGRGVKTDPVEQAKYNAEQQLKATKDQEKIMAETLVVLQQIAAQQVPPVLKKGA